LGKIAGAVGSIMPKPYDYDELEQRLRGAPRRGADHAGDAA
jgi:hypothetical protein